MALLGAHGGARANASEAAEGAWIDLEPLSWCSACTVALCAALTLAALGGGLAPVGACIVLGHAGQARSFGPGQMGGINKHWVSCLLDIAGHGWQWCLMDELVYGSRMDPR